MAGPADGVRSTSRGCGSSEGAQPSSSRSEHPRELARQGGAGGSSDPTVPHAEGGAACSSAGALFGGDLGGGASQKKTTLPGRLRRYFERALAEGSTPIELGAATFLGVLVGVSPFYGLQMLLVLLLATLLRLNRLTALAAVQISIPPVYPFLVVASLEAGSLVVRGDWLGTHAADLPSTWAGWWRLLSDLAGVWLAGSLIVGALLGLLSGGLVAVLAVVTARGAPDPEGEA